MENHKLKLYKIGKFYSAYKDDGYIIHELLGYKYIEYKQSVGFPESAFGKVKQKLESNNVVSKFKGVNKCYNQVLRKALDNIKIESRINRLKEIIDNSSNEEIESIIEAIEDGRFKKE